MLDLRPNVVFFTKGDGRAKEQLASFEAALRDAGLAPFNLVPVSSILPPNCKIISKEKGLQYLKPGQIVFVVLARNSSNEPNRLISASIGMAVPADRNNYGYLSELHAFGMTQKKAGDLAEDLAATMLASTLGVEFDPDKAWSEREQEYKASGQIFKTSNITQTSEVDKNGLWTSVVAAAVFAFVDEEILQGKKTEEKEIIQIPPLNLNQNNNNKEVSTQNKQQNNAEQTSINQQSRK